MFILPAAIGGGENKISHPEKLKGVRNDRF
jgi:hypothetical protein